MEPVKVGVIGCGVIGSRHLGIASEASHIELVAAADMIAQNRTNAVKRFNPPKMYSNDIELLNDDEVEAVVLAFPTQYRTEVALRAFESGKHVLIEKPIAMNTAEVEHLITARGRLNFRMLFLSEPFQCSCTACDTTHHDWRFGGPA